MDYNDGLQFENLSGDESIETEDRADEIKELLVSKFDNETFDDESEHSFIGQESTQNSFCTNINGHLVDKNHNIFNNNNTTDKQMVISNGVHSFLNGLGLEVPKNGLSSSNSNGKKVRFQSNSPNGKENDGSSSSSTTTTTTSYRQSDRGTDEIVVKNPTISLLHQNHCPQNGDDEIGSEIWTESGNIEERLKTICHLRERQVQRAEETIQALNKDKRSLNHHIGLMKTEMIQMKNNQEDLEKVLQLRDDEIKYLKTKMTEAIEEFEEVKKRELAAKKESSHYMDEVSKLQQQVTLLSSIGSSSQQAEVDQVVRQIREKHAKEIAAWKAAVKDLESQLVVLKRNQHSIHDESFVVEKQSIALQTDEIHTSPFIGKTNCKDFGQTVNLVQPFQQTNLHEDLVHNGRGGGGDADLYLLQSTNGDTRLDKWKQAFAKSEEEKNQLMDFYEKEMEEYKTKLALLPAQLYSVWQKQQEELGLFYGVNHNSSTNSNTPASAGKSLLISRDIGLVTDQPNIHSIAIQTENTNIPFDLNNKQQPNGHSTKEEIRVAQKKMKNSASNTTGSSLLQSTTEKESSSVVIQTEETLETYHELSILIEQWVKEVAASSKRAEDAEHEKELIEVELKRFKSKFREFHKNTLECKKQWQEQEKYLRQKYEDSRSKCIDILSQVSEKLDIDI